MKLKASVKNLNDVPSEYQGLYTQVGDVFVLDIDDKDYKTTLSEFRDNNVDLLKQVQNFKGTSEELETLRKQIEQYDGLDAEKARAAIEKMQAIEEKNLIDAGDIDSVVEQRVNQRVERMRAEYEGQTKAMQKALEEAQSSEGTLRGRLSEVVIDNSLQQSVAGVGAIRKGAMQDVLARGRQVWKLDDQGNPVPMSNGEVMYGKDGKAPLSMEEWGQMLMSEAPYLFEGNSGGGAGGNLEGEVGSIISSSDQDSMSANLEDIATGKVGVSVE